MRIPRIFAVLAAVVLILGSAAAVVAANTYVDLKGNFYFNYPDDWVQVDHRIVDMFLSVNKAGKNTLDYDAAFAPAAQTPFYNGAYFILTVDTVSGGYSDRQIDSILTAMSGRYGEKVKYFPVADLLADMKSNQPGYDAERKIITVVNDIVEKGQILKKHLLVEKFFDNGVATFYFYAPVETFDESQKLFNGMLDSFHSGDAESMLPKETLKVADLKTEEGSGDNGSSATRFLPWSILVALIIVIVIARKKKRKTK